MTPDGVVAEVDERLVERRFVRLPTGDIVGLAGDPVTLDPLARFYRPYHDVGTGPAPGPVTAEVRVACRHRPIDRPAVTDMRTYLAPSAPVAVVGCRALWVRPETGIAIVTDRARQTVWLVGDDPGEVMLQLRTVVRDQAIEQETNHDVRPTAPGHGHAGARCSARRASCWPWPRGTRPGSWPPSWTIRWWPRRPGSSSAGLTSRRGRSPSPPRASNSERWPATSGWPPAAMVYVDDDATHLAEVASALPEVRGLRFPRAAELGPFLRQLRAQFATGSLSEEDRADGIPAFMKVYADPDRGRVETRYLRRAADAPVELLGSGEHRGRRWAVTRSASLHPVTGTVAAAPLARVVARFHAQGTAGFPRHPTGAAALADAAPAWRRAGAPARWPGGSPRSRPGSGPMSRRPRRPRPGPDPCCSTVTSGRATWCGTTVGWR